MAILDRRDKTSASTLWELLPYSGSKSYIFESGLKQSHMSTIFRAACRRYISTNTKLRRI